MSGERPAPPADSSQRGRRGRAAPASSQVAGAGVKPQSARRRFSAGETSVGPSGVGLPRCWPPTPRPRQVSSTGSGGGNEARQRPFSRAPKRLRARGEPGPAPEENAPGGLFLTQAMADNRTNTATVELESWARHPIQVCRAATFASVAAWPSGSCGDRVRRYEPLGQSSMAEAGRRAC